MEQPLKSPFYERHGLWIALLGVLLAPFAVAAGLTALLNNANEVADWLPSDYVETAEYQWFRQQFPNDEFALVSWEGCTLDDPRLDQFAALLLSGELPAGSDGNNRFPRVVTGRSALNDLMASFGDLSRDDAIQNLRGSLVGPDNRQTCAIASLTNAARGDTHRTLAILREAASQVGVPPEEVRLGGPPVVNAAIDKVSSQSLNQVVVLSCFVVSFIAWMTIRDLRLTILVLVSGLYSSAISLAVLWITGQKMNAVLVTMIPMVYVAATSAAIHLCNYYQESVREAGVFGAAGRAVAHAWVPLGLATATTAAGLLSICYTDLALIRSFGVYSAVGVALSWVLLVTWLPAVLTVWRPRRAAAKENHSTVDALSEETGEAPLPPFWENLGKAVVRRPVAISTVCLLLWIVSIPGLSRMEVSIDLMQEFRREADIIQTYTWLEEKLGPLMPMEVIVRMDETCRLGMKQRIDLVEKLQARVETLPDTGGAISAATYVPDVTAPGPIWLRQGILNKRLERQRDRLVGTGYLTASGDEELWRITVRVAALREVNYTELVAALKGQVNEELASDEYQGVDGVSVTYTGVAPVLFKARQSLVDGLYFGVVTDLVLIIVTVTLIMRHWSNGLLMAFTSLFPTFLVLGTVGWLGIKVDMGAIMAPCVALGVTVDDVIHFLLWYRKGVQRGSSREDAVMLAWRACLRPMYQSWALLGLGMSCLMISAFLPILQFGAIMMAMLTVGLLGNLFFLPTLLAGPLGGVIARQSGARDSAAALHPLSQTGAVPHSTAG